MKHIARKRFGQNFLTDVHASFKIADLIFNILIVSAISSAVVPILTELNSHGKEQRSREVTDQLLTWATLCLAVLIGLFWLAAPLIMVLAKSPMILVVELIAGLAILGFAVLIHAVTLPVEFDASFGRALPVLQAGGYIKPADMPAARKLLRAAALTYVAASAMTLLDVMRWLRVLRF